MQAPFTQVPPTAQAAWHEPQLALSVSRFVSQPLLELPSQLPKPESHVPKTHVPLLQLGVSFGNEQAWPQLPQLFGSVLRLTHTPLQAV